MIGKDIKRKLIQLASFGFCNSHINGFAEGKIYDGKLKTLCCPGMNCYSCPAATLSCPLGAMQAVAGSRKFNFSFYVVGILLAFGVMFGRAIFGYVCPFGLIQELFAKIPLRKFHLPKWLTYLKYVLLAVFVVLLPVVMPLFSSASGGVGDPAFCKYICPVGTLEGSIPLMSSHEELRSVAGSLFILKASILVITIIACIFIQRFFCKALCPLGAIYGLLNKISFLRLKIDTKKCTACGTCSHVCPMDVNPLKYPDSAECIRCGRCVDKCPEKAIHIGIQHSHH